MAAARTSRGDTGRGARRQPLLSTASAYPSTNSTFWELADLLSQVRPEIVMLRVLRGRTTKGRSVWRDAVDPDGKSE